MARSSTPWQLNESQGADVAGQAALPGVSAQPASEDGQPMGNGAEARSRDGSALGAPSAPAS